VTVRRARVTDARALARLDAELAAEPGIMLLAAPDEVRSVADQREALERLRDEPRTLVLVAVPDAASVRPADEVLGTLTLRGMDLRAVEHVAVLGMAVAASARSRGVGTALLAAAIDWAHEVGLRRLELNTYAPNLAAQALYRRFGFVEEGRRRAFVRYQGAYVDDLVMGLLLPG